MRLYTFTNTYLSTLQVGIQSAHCVSELFNKYNISSDDWEYVSQDAKIALDEWASAHKTIICLNGGNNVDLLDLFELISVLARQNDLPYIQFREDEDSLGGILTCVGVIVPDYIYNCAQAMREPLYDRTQFAISDEAVELAVILSGRGLAR